MTGKYLVLSTVEASKLAHSPELPNLTASLLF